MTSIVKSTFAIAWKRRTDWLPPSSVVRAPAGEKKGSVLLIDGAVAGGGPGSGRVQRPPWKSSETGAPGAQARAPTVASEMRVLPDPSVG